jgi:hypothetical protein
VPYREPQLRYWVAGAITVCWVVSVIADIAITMYDPPNGIHSLMLTVAGGIFGQGVVSAARGAKS